MGINVFSGCQETTPQNLIYETVSPIVTLDPQSLSGETDIQVAYSIYGTLMRFDNGGNIVPYLASGYTVSKNNRIYTFTISDTAVWSNGSKITAHDFVYAFKRAVSKETNAPFAHTLSLIQNASKILKGQKSNATLGVTAKNDTTLEIKLAYPCIDFLQILTTPITAPCNQRFFESTKGYYGLNDEAILTCGNYTLSTWNENYCKIKSENNSVYFYFDNEEKYLESFEKQNVDISKPNYTMLDKLEKFYNNGKLSFITDTANFLVINPSSTIANENIINALMSVANYTPNETISNTYGAYTLNSVYPQSVIGTSNIVTLDNSAKYKDQAESLFLEGCEEFGNEFVAPALNFIYINDPVSHNAAINIAGVWQNRFGITVNIEAVDSLDTLNYRIKEKLFDFAIIPVTAYLPSSHSYIEEFSSGALMQSLNIDSSELTTETTKLHKGSSEKSLSKISKMICDNTYIKPIYQSSKVYYIKNEITAPINSYSKRIEFENAIKQ